MVWTEVNADFFLFLSYDRDVLRRDLYKLLIENLAMPPTKFISFQYTPQQQFPHFSPLLQMPLHKMEPAGVISERNWSSYSALEQSEASEIMAHLFDNFPSQSEQDQEEFPFGAPSLSWPGQCPNQYSYHGNGSSFVYNWSQGDSNSEYESYYLNDSIESIGVVCSQPAPMDLSFGQDQHRNRNLCMILNSPLKDRFFSNREMPGEERGDSSMNLLGSVGLSDRIAQPKRKFSIGSEEKTTEYSMFDAPAEGHEKKARVTRQARKCTKETKSKRNQKSGQSRDGEESNAALTGQDSGCCSSDDDSNTLQEINGGAGTSSSSKRCSALNLNGKTKAGRASAADSQSLYARKRRERINERLRILQNLVPNGTKVDISTMLDEAVHYVKFLQLQIKLLSSDELWMYAPIAYNGMNVGIDLMISPHEQSS